MTRKGHSADEIVAKLRKVDAMTLEGRPVAQAVRSIGVAVATYYRWRAEYGGLARMLGSRREVVPQKPKI
jgi:putative transposase